MGRIFAFFKFLIDLCVLFVQFFFLGFVVIFGGIDIMLLLYLLCKWCIITLNSM